MLHFIFGFIRYKGFTEGTNRAQIQCLLSLYHHGLSISFTYGFLGSLQQAANEKEENLSLVHGCVDSKCLTSRKWSSALQPIYRWLQNIEVDESHPLGRASSSTYSHQFYVVGTEVRLYIDSWEMVKSLVWIIRGLEEENWKIRNKKIWRRGI